MTTICACERTLRQPVPNNSRLARTRLAREPAGWIAPFRGEGLQELSALDDRSFLIVPSSRLAHSRFYFSPSSSSHAWYQDLRDRRCRYARVHGSDACGRTRLPHQACADLQRLRRRLLRRDQVIGA